MSGCILVCARNVKLLPSLFSDLMNEVYSVGRSPECDVRITESNVDSTLASVISKIQFKLWKKILENGSYVVYLKDLSMNGTFVNRVKVGKFNEIALCNGDEISLARAHNRGIYFYLHVEF